MKLINNAFIVILITVINLTAQDKSLCNLFEKIIASGINDFKDAKGEEIADYRFSSNFPLPDFTSNEIRVTIEGRYSAFYEYREEKKGGASLVFQMVRSSLKNCSSLNLSEEILSDEDDYKYLTYKPAEIGNSGYLQTDLNLEGSSVRVDIFYAFPELYEIVEDKENIIDEEFTSALLKIMEAATANFQSLQGDFIAGFEDHDRYESKINLPVVEEPGFINFYPQFANYYTFIKSYTDKETADKELQRIIKYVRGAFSVSDYEESKNTFEQETGHSFKFTKQPEGYKTILDNVIVNVRAQKFGEYYEAFINIYYDDISLLSGYKLNKNNWLESRSFLFV